MARFQDATLHVSEGQSEATAGHGGEPDKLYKRIELEVRGHDTAVLKSYKWYALEAAKLLDIKVSRTWQPKRVHERWTLLKAPFGKKKHMVQYEMRTHFEVIEWILDPPPNFGGGTPPCFSLSYGGGRSGCGGSSTPSSDSRNDFRSLPLSVAQERKLCHSTPSQPAGTSTRTSLHARPSHLPTSSTPVHYSNFPPSPVASSERDIPDVVSRPVLAAASGATPGSLSTSTCRRGCGEGDRSVAVTAGANGGCAPAWLSAPPSSPRRTHSDPIIHLDDVDEEQADNPGIWTYRPRITVLWNQVQHLQSQLELLRRIKSPDKPPSTSVNGVSFAELLADVYYAQRERDDSISERLASANQSLDLYQKELQKLAEARSDASDGSSDEENCDNLVLSGLDKILQGLESSWAPARVTRHQETLLATVQRLRDHRGKRARHRLRAIQAERDVALEKVKVLEKEVQELHMKAIWKSENWGCSSNDAVQQATNERNAALGRLQELQESLAAQANNGNRGTGDGVKISAEAQTDFIGVQDGIDLAASSCLQQLKEEVSRISQRLDEEAASRQNAEMKCQR
ncbi:hypothetical protein HPB52_002753 [Rhipicephalus sanguineus]|uniref:Small ribosomal subunit protein uS10m n=1 Tax=Rhipicephalus sanguineus TaxID=34632 RepID=A0A9D4QAG5_RHISA|nr:hypothetical protein HPB52_002753 [Rhipicephalus sanguineus]